MSGSLRTSYSRPVSIHRNETQRNEEPPKAANDANLQVDLFSSAYKVNNKT